MVNHNYTIGELSKISGISKSALRLYDEKGLLRPLERDDNNNYRLYSEQQISDSLMIREMKRRGFSMTEIKELLKKHDLHTLAQGLKKKALLLEKELTTIQEQLNYLTITEKAVSKAIDLCADIEKNKKEMVIDIMPETTILFERRRSRVNAQQVFWDRYNDIYQLCEKEQVTIDGLFSAIFYDHYLNQFFFDEGDLEVYLPIKETQHIGPHIRKMGGFQRASMVYIGVYSELLATYVELVKQIEHNHYKIVGPAYEEYLVEGSYGIAPEQCVTQISFPVEKME